MARMATRDFLVIFSAMSTPFNSRLSLTMNGNPIQSNRVYRRLISEDGFRSLRAQALRICHVPKLEGFALTNFPFVQEALIYVMILYVTYVDYVVVDLFFALMSDVCRKTI